MMRIIVMRLGTSNFGKIGTYNVQEVGLANALKRKGHNVDVLYLNKDVDKIEDDKTYPFVHYLPHKHIGLHGIFDVNLLKKYNPDRIILFSDNQLWAKNVIQWCRKNNVPIVHYFGNVLSDNPKWLHQFYTKLILLRNRRSYKYSINVAKTNKVRDEMEKHRIRCDSVINVGLDKDILNNSHNLDLVVRDGLGFKRDEIIILFVGRLVDYKKPLLACDIVERINKEGTKAKLVIIGKGQLEDKLKEYIKEKRIEDYVEYHGRVGYEEMYKYFVASDCLINLSSQEIFGMTILEAMYYGLPVIAHTAPGPNDIIDNGVDGILIDSDDIKLWGRQIHDILINKNYFAENSKNKIRNHYMWDSICSEFLMTS